MKALFGIGKDSKTKQKEQQQKIAETEQEKDFEKQAKIVSIQRTLEEMKIKVDDGYTKLEQKQNKIKDLIRLKRKNEAKKQLQLLKIHQEELAKLENMCIILERTKIQIEVARDTGRMIDAMKDAASLQKDIEKTQEELQDILLDQQEQKQQNEEIKNLIAELAAPEDEEEIDEEYRRMEQELMDNEEMEISQNKKKVTQKPEATKIPERKVKVEENSFESLIASSLAYN